MGGGTGLAIGFAIGFAIGLAAGFATAFATFFVTGRVTGLVGGGSAITGGTSTVAGGGAGGSEGAATAAGTVGVTVGVGGATTGVGVRAGSTAVWLGDGSDVPIAIAAATPALPATTAASAHGHTRRLTRTGAGARIVGASSEERSAAGCASLHDSAVAGRDDTRSSASRVSPADA